MVRLCLAIARRNNEANLLTTTTSELNGQNVTITNVEDNIVQDDPSFAAGLTEDLLPILTILTHTSIMRNPNVFNKAPDKAEWWTPLDYLASFV